MSFKNLNRAIALGALVISTAWLTGCGTTQSSGVFESLPSDGAPIPESAAATTPAVGVAEPKPVDTIQPGEAITITFSDLPVPVAPIEERVKEDGTISLLQNKSFVAAGKTRSQLEKEIRDAYVPKYYVNMSVSVKQQENTRFYFVGGEVRAPGRQVYLGPMTVLKAIQSCGDVTDYANRRKVRLIRSNGKIEIVNLKKALQDPKLDLPVFPGDRIHVPRSIW